jgi:HKD family nuclease
MKSIFLGQGFEAISANAVGNYLIGYLNSEDFHSFTGISAFASEAGIFGLAGHIEHAKKNFTTLRLIVGIDQEGTSEEALKEITNLDIDSYIFYQSESPIFHPKIYLFEGSKNIRLIIGSSNLTARGLFTNVESSLLIEFDNDDLEGLTLLTELKAYYNSLFDLSDPNLFKIDSSTIADFIAKGIVPDEATRRRIYSAKAAPGNSITTTLPGGAIIPKRATARISNLFPAKSRGSGMASGDPRIPNTGSISPIAPTRPTQINAASQQKMLVWQKLSLSQSDAQQVSSGTAVTANLKLSQARFRVDNVFIDQTTYFRNSIFNALTWVKTKPNNNSYEEAFCSFDITILGNPIGIQVLKLSHDPVRIAGQGNTPTWLHWGALLSTMQQTNITGKTLDLYQSGSAFFIEIF